MNGPDYRAPLTLERVHELAGESHAAGTDRLREIVAQLVDHIDVTDANGRVE